MRTAAGALNTAVDDGANDDSSDGGAMLMEEGGLGGSAIRRAPPPLDYHKSPVKEDDATTLLAFATSPAASWEPPSAVQRKLDRAHSHISQVERECNELRQQLAARTLERDTLLQTKVDVEPTTPPPVMQVN
jgi:hypothetical protein